MKSLKVVRKSISIVVAILIMLGIILSINTNNVYATENESDLNEIFEVYNNSEDLPDGMLLAPNPNVDDTELNDVLDAYKNSDQLEDGAVLAPNPNAEQELISPALEKNTNVGLIIGIVVVAVAVVGGIVIIIKKRK